MSTLKKNPARWHDGRSFASRVRVFDAGDAYLYKTHAEEARRLCHAKVAQVACEDKLIWKIVLVLTPPPHLRTGAPSPFSAYSYGTRYVRRELYRDGRGRLKPVHQPTHINDNDGWAFRMASLDGKGFKYPYNNIGLDVGSV